VSYSVKIQSSFHFWISWIVMSSRHAMTSAPCRWSPGIFGLKGLPSASRMAYLFENFRLTVTNFWCCICCRVGCLTLHSGPLAAHLGAERMLQQLRSITTGRVCDVTCTTGPSTAHNVRRVNLLHLRHL